MELASLRWNEANNNRTGSENSYFQGKFLLCMLPHTDRWCSHSTVSSVKFRGSSLLMGGPSQDVPSTWGENFTLLLYFQMLFNIILAQLLETNITTNTLQFKSSYFSLECSKTSYINQHESNMTKDTSTNISCQLDSFFSVRTRKIQVNYTCLHQDSKSILLLGKHKLQQNLHLLAYQKKNSLQPATEDTMKAII